MQLFLQPHDSTRRYDVLHYDNGNILGRNGEDKFAQCGDSSERVR